MLGSKPIEIDLTKELNLTQPDRKVSVSSVSWLPLMVAEEMSRLEALISDTSDNKTSSFSDVTDAIAKIMAWVVTDWNLTNEDLSLDRVDGFDGDPEAVAPIPSVDIQSGRAMNMHLAMVILGVAGEDDGEVPLASESKSSDEPAPESLPQTSPVEAESS